MDANLKDQNLKEYHENIRKKLWCDVYVAYVGAANATKEDGASRWADIALKRFDDAFPCPDKDLQITDK